MDFTNFGLISANKTSWKIFWNVNRENKYSRKIWKQSIVENKSSEIKKINCIRESNSSRKFLRIQSEWGKIRTRKAPNRDTFHAVKCKVTFICSRCLWAIKNPKLNCFYNFESDQVSDQVYLIRSLFATFHDSKN